MSENNALTDRRIHVAGRAAPDFPSTAFPLKFGKVTLLLDSIGRPFARLRALFSEPFRSKSFRCSFPISLGAELCHVLREVALFGLPLGSISPGCLQRILESPGAPRCRAGRLGDPLFLDIRILLYAVHNLPSSHAENTSRQRTRTSHTATATACRFSHSRANYTDA